MGEKVLLIHVSYLNQHPWLHSSLGSDCGVAGSKGLWRQMVWSSLPVKHFSTALVKHLCIRVQSSFKAQQQRLCAIACVQVGTVTLSAALGHTQLCMSDSAIGNSTSASQWTTAGQEWVPAGDYDRHLLPHILCGAWPVSSACPRLSVHPLDVPPREVHNLEERWELQDISFTGLVLITGTLKKYPFTAHLSLSFPRNSNSRKENGCT